MFLLSSHGHRVSDLDIPRLTAGGYYPELPGNANILPKCHILQDIDTIRLSPAPVTVQGCSALEHARFEIVCLLAVLRGRTKIGVVLCKTIQLLKRRRASFWGSGGYRIWGRTHPHKM
jgi:hypothetical protein